EGSRPVRVGNAAHEQFQLDVYGELADAMYHARLAGLKPAPAGWNVGRAIIHFVEKACNEPDEGIWEVRGPRQHFTHSKVMAWVAFDRAIRGLHEFGTQDDIDAATRFAAIRDEIHAEVCAKAYDADRKTFVQAYGSSNLDAAL